MKLNPWQYPNDGELRIAKAFNILSYIYLIFMNNYYYFIFINKIFKDINNKNIYS